MNERRKTSKRNTRKKKDKEMITKVLHNAKEEGRNCHNLEENHKLTFFGKDLINVKLD
jgi:hypothetical protein